MTFTKWQACCSHQDISSVLLVIVVVYMLSGLLFSLKIKIGQHLKAYQCISRSISQAAFEFCMGYQIIIVIPFKYYC